MGVFVKKIKRNKAVFNFRKTFTSVHLFLLQVEIK